jgi:UDP-3-O-[3-hydroxymyristoyl] N-acetylglucosamine deacetylase
MNQKTIASSVSCSGVGIHSGQTVDLTISPAPAGQGINFIRTDLNPQVRIPAIWENIKCGINASTLGVNGTRVGTVEHLLAALAGLGIDNAEVYINGPELPILDGSAGPFVDMLKDAGIVELDAARSWLVVKKPVEARINGSRIEIRPSSMPAVQCTISFNHPMLEHQERKTTFRSSEFVSDIAGARTFGFLQDVERLQSVGLALGGSLDNAVVFDDDGIVNEEGLRWQDECVRHKILDIIGDLSLAGRPIMGEVIAHKSGHALNHMLLRELLTSPASYEIVDNPFLT